MAEFFEGRKGTGFPTRCLSFSCLALLLIAFLSFLYSALPPIGYPFGVHSEEGVVLDGARRALEDPKALYSSLEKPPYVKDRSGPLYLYLLAGLNVVFGKNYFAGRAISFLSCIAISLLAALLIDPKLKSTEAFLGASFFLGSYISQSYASLCRPEVLSVLLSTASLYVALQSRKNPFLCAILSLVAFWILPCMLLPACAWLIPVALNRREKRYQSVLLFFASLVFPFASFLLVKGLPAIWHLFPWGLGKFSFGKWLSQGLGTILSGTFPSLVLCIFAWANLRRDGLRYLLVLSFLDTFRIGFPLEDRGALLFCLLSIFVCAGRALADLKRYRWAAGCAILQLVFLAAYQGSLYFPISREKEMLRRDEEISQVIRNVKGDMLSEEVGYLPLLGKRIFCDPLVWDQMVHSAKAEEDQILKLLREGRFGGGLLVSDSLFALPSKLGEKEGRFSGEVRSWIRKHFKSSRTVLFRKKPGVFSVYEIYWGK